MGEDVNIKMMVFSSGDVPLHSIHCDHTTALNNICSSWKQARLNQMFPKRWDAGIVRTKLLKCFLQLERLLLSFVVTGVTRKKPITINRTERVRLLRFLAAVPIQLANPIHLE